MIGRVRVIGQTSKITTFRAEALGLVCDNCIADNKFVPSVPLQQPCHGRNIRSRMNFSPPSRTLVGNSEMIAGNTNERSVITIEEIAAINKQGAKDQHDSRRVQLLARDLLEWRGTCVMPQSFGAIAPTSPPMLIADPRQEPAGGRYRLR
jgi:hypothetical protein